jgi:hypothetical protein
MVGKMTSRGRVMTFAAIALIAAVSAVTVQTTRAPLVRAAGVGPAPQGTVMVTRGFGLIPGGREARASDPMEGRVAVRAPIHRTVVNLVFPYQVPTVTYEMTPASSPPTMPLLWQSCPNMTGPGTVRPNATPCLSPACSHMLMCSRPR